MTRRALLSVSDKSGVVEFASGLRQLGYELYSTGGTLTALREGAVEVASVSELTGFPEIMEGRVKTLHPGVHGGLLARRDEPEHMAALERHGIRPIDLVCVNLYPFAATVARAGATFAEIVEQIDIGGPAMLRAAAKNHEHVIVVTRPAAYGDVLAALAEQQVTPALRRRLAAEALAHTAAYDALISAWLRGLDGDGFPEELTVAGALVQRLRYGENPHQQAAFYGTGTNAGGLGNARQLQGQELSYNNLQDAAAAFELVSEFEGPAAAIIKHMNPCGVAAADSAADAYRRAYECDPVSAYGGVVALNRPLDRPAAEAMAAIFLEVVLAPEVTPEAADLLRSRSRLRLLEVPPVGAAAGGLQLRSVPGGLLVQSADSLGFVRGDCRVVTRKEPDSGEWEQLEFAWLVAKHVKSNAIVLAKDAAAVGVGAGQMSRVEAVKLAVMRAGERARGSVLASDAFFPFPDGVEEAAAAGVTAVIQPGGSVRDAEVIAVADRAGIAMVCTGTRHFLH